MTIDDARLLLAQLWREVQAGSGPNSRHEVPAEIRDAIERAVNSKTKSYRYVLPTQLLAKALDTDLHAQAVQESSDLVGSYDARSFCRAVVVPFDRQLHSVLGGSGDPYVSNPLRIAAIDESAAAAQKNRKDFEKLRQVLVYAQAHPEATPDLLRDVLRAISKRLDRVRIAYPVPNRVSLDAAKDLFRRFLATRSGGRRMQAVAVALFQTMGRRFALYDEVESAHVNASDLRTGRVADLECQAGGNVVLAVEVKDRRLAIREVEDKMDSLRERGIGEFLYVLRGDVEPQDADAIRDLKARQFASGHNIYHCEFDDFLSTMSMMLGEDGRRELLVVVGTQIDEYGELADRETLRDLLADI